MRRTFLFLSPFLLSLGLQAADANATKANTHKVKAAPFHITIDFKGTFAAVKSHPVRVRPQAWTDLTVARDAVAHGTHVSAKDVLLNLKTDKLEQKIADSQLALEVAKLDMAVAKVEYAFATNNAALDKTARRPCPDAAPVLIVSDPRAGSPIVRRASSRWRRRVFRHARRDA